MGVSYYNLFAISFLRDQNSTKQTVEKRLSFERVNKSEKSEKKTKIIYITFSHKGN